MSYFRNFPIVQYRYGDDDQPLVYTQNISTFADLLAGIEDQVTLYENYTILDNERPDTLSYKLYGTTDYYWTFFLLNSKLREGGWPLTFQRRYEYSEKLFPNWVFSVESVSVAGETMNDDYIPKRIDYLAGKFPVGQRVIVTNTAQEGFHARVIKKNLELGQIIFDPELFANGSVITREQADINMAAATSIKYIDINNGSVPIEATDIIHKTIEYNAIHHYETTDGEYADIDTFNLVSSAVGLVPITNQERLFAKNEDQKIIKVFNEDVVGKVAGEFNRAIKG